MGMVWLARLADDQQVAEIIAKPENAYEYVNSQSEGNFYEDDPHLIDLDKEWHGTHFLLEQAIGRGEASPSLILGDFEAIGPDMGYGPVNYISREQIAEFHTAIAALSNEQISAGFDTEAMEREGIYLADVFAMKGEEAKEFLMERVNQLRTFSKLATQAGLDAFSVIT